MVGAGRFRDISSEYCPLVISSGHSVTSCAVRNSQAVCSPLPICPRSVVPRGSRNPSDWLASSARGAKRTIAADGVGAR